MRFSDSPSPLTAPSPLAPSNSWRMNGRAGVRAVARAARPGPPPATRAPAHPRDTTATGTPPPPPHVAQGATVTCCIPHVFHPEAQSHRMHLECLNADPSKTQLPLSPLSLPGLQPHDHVTMMTMTSATGPFVSSDRSPGPPGRALMSYSHTSVSPATAPA